MKDPSFQIEFYKREAACEKAASKTLIKKQTMLHDFIFSNIMLNKASFFRANESTCISSENILRDNQIHNLFHFNRINRFNRTIHR